MQIVLKRLKSRPQATDGQLYINNVIVADTAEATPYMLSEGVYDIKICLLYTSPSPRDATLSRMPSSA